MHFTAILSAIGITALVAVSDASPVRLNMPKSQYVLTANNTINSTANHNSTPPATPPPASLTLNFINNYAGANQLNAYLTGLDDVGAAFFLLANGQPYYPTNPASGIPPSTITQNLAIPLDTTGKTFSVQLSNYVTSGRIYFSASPLSFAVNYGQSGPIVVAPSFTNPSDPSIESNYGFVEFTWSKDGGLYTNLSYVDFIGLVIGQLVTTASSGTCEVKGLPSGSVPTICSALRAQASQDGQPWDKSCQQDSQGNDIRVLAPLHLTEVDQNALSTYYSGYIDQVWSQYTNQPLTITSGNSNIGNFTGKVDTSTGLLTFDHGGTFAKPSITDIMGCNGGPFANPSTYDQGNQVENTARQTIVPRLCAAFHRSTLLLPGGNVQPDGVDASQYYSVSPTNHYSRIVHAHELDGKGYAFAYDDVHSSTAPDVSGLCVAGPGDARSISFSVGGAMSGNGW